MTDKELALYLKRLSSELRNVYNAISQQMPDDAMRHGGPKGNVKLSIQRQEDLWRESNPDAESTHFLIPGNPPADNDYGKFTALDALDAFIEDLNNDIATLLEEKS
jgi:hypothetical protein